MRETIQNVGLRIVVSVLVVTMLISSIGTVYADDKWPSKCGKNTPILKTGTYSGSLSPGDQDAFRIALDKGDYASIHLLYSPPGMDAQTTGLQTTVAPARVSPLYVHWEGNTEVSFTSKNGGELHDPPRVNTNYRHGFRLSMTDLEFRAYSEEQGPVCILFESEENTAGEWRMALATNDVKPPKLDAEAITAQQELEQRVDRLENRIAELEQRVSTLEAELEAPNNSTTATG
ncbi:hypothetical protein [Halorussus salinisoli]|uniref:hypothetical protein n=1 Tax=Halorussus salinisoli TaxID=2558242 RepID=UPI0010C22A02|nr:hypothetical protein [Halorussus salinisoli]